MRFWSISFFSILYLLFFSIVNLFLSIDGRFFPATPAVAARVKWPQRSYVSVVVMYVVVESVATKIICVRKN